MDKQFIEDIKSLGEWTRLLERNVRIIIQNLIFEGEKSPKFNKALGKSIPPIGDSFVNGFIFSPKKSLVEAANAIQSIVNESGYSALNSISTNCEKTAKELLTHLKNNQNLSSANLRIIKELYSNLTSYLLVIVFSEKYLTKKIEELIITKTGSLNQEYFNALVYTKKYNDNTKELISLLKICQGKNTIDNHLKKYGWLGTRWHFEPSWTSKDIQNRIKNYKNKNIERELKNILEPRKIANKKTKEFITKYHLSKKEIELIEIVKEFVYLRTFRTENIAHANYFLKNILQKISKKYTYSVNDLTYLTIDEIIEILNGKNFTNTIKERKKGYHILLCNDTIKIFTGKDKILIKKLPNFQSPKTDLELKGNIGWPGKISGKAKIVKKYEDIKKVQKGDILVAIMTFPNFIPAMEKAAAFVTDEGGILCHASIVAREMQKPCIIGTKNATRILKDGDLIEVDANKGIIKKIK